MGLMATVPVRTRFPPAAAFLSPAPPLLSEHILLQLLRSSYPIMLFSLRAHCSSVSSLRLLNPGMGALFDRPSTSGRVNSAMRLSCALTCCSEEQRREEKREPHCALRKPASGPSSAHLSFFAKLVARKSVRAIPMLPSNMKSSFCA